jgi:hypothetical protein
MRFPTSPFHHSGDLGVAVDSESTIGRSHMADEKPAGDFAEGERTEPRGPQRDFAEGEEKDTPGREHDFAEGQEKHAAGPKRDFAEGQEDEPPGEA